MLSFIPFLKPVKHKTDLSHSIITVLERLNHKCETSSNAPSKITFLRQLYCFIHPAPAGWPPTWFFSPGKQSNVTRSLAEHHPSARQTVCTPAGRDQRKRESGVYTSGPANAARNNAGLRQVLLLECTMEGYAWSSVDREIDQRGCKNCSSC